MAQGFLTRPLGLGLLTLAVAVALLGLGHELCRSNLEPQLHQAQAQLAAENQRLETRLTQAQARRPVPPHPAEAPAPPSPRPEPRPPESGEPEPSGGRLLHRGEAAELAGGRLVLGLESVGGDPRQAQLLLRQPGGQEQSLRLAPGGQVAVHLEDGGSYRLMLRKILVNSVVYALRPLDEAPRPRRGR